MMEKRRLVVCVHGMGSDARRLKNGLTNISVDQINTDYLECGQKD